MSDLFVTASTGYLGTNLPLWRFRKDLGGMLVPVSGASMSNSADFSADRGPAVASLALERIVRSPAALVENLPIGICTCDRDGLLVQFNRRAAELWGRTPVTGDS